LSDLLASKDLSIGCVIDLITLLTVVTLYGLWLTPHNVLWWSILVALILNLWLDQMIAISVRRAAVELGMSKVTAVLFDNRQRFLRIVSFCMSAALLCLSVVGLYFSFAA